MWDQFVYVLSTASVYLNVLVSSAFVVLYAREPWQRTPFGRAIMALGVSIVIFSVLGFLVTVLGENYPLREEVRALGRLVITGAMTTVLVVLVRMRRKP